LSTNTLGRYHIIREIARSNDIVYEATDPASGRRIALKELQIPANLVGQARHERVERFTREARAAARLQHTNIVRVLDHKQVQGRYYIAMEYLEGQSLRDILRQRGALPLQEALRIAAAVADGLEYAHSHGVVHRDVKPDNVHLEPDGRVVITDFGIARLTFEPSLTADGQIFGTPSYMSPEQVTGKGLDRRSDLFSLGVMLYEMISGRKPFVGDSVVTITYNIINMEPPPAGGAPPAVDRVIRRALAKDMARRYASAADLAEDLRLVAQGREPRYASMPAAAAAPQPRPSAPPPRPQSAPPRAPAGPPGGARPMPQPMFGNGAPANGQRPTPGARPMGGAPPASRPQPSGPAHQPPPAGAMQLPQAASGSSAAALRARPAPAGTDVKWLLAWLGVAVILGLLIMTVVWATVTAHDKFRQDQVTGERRTEANQLILAANDALKREQWEEALRLSRQVADTSTGNDRATARKNAALSALQLAMKELARNQWTGAEGRCREALAIDPTYAAAYVVLGQALDGQGRLPDAIQAFDQGHRAAAEEAKNGPPAERERARGLAAKALEWKLRMVEKQTAGRAPAPGEGASSAGAGGPSAPTQPAAPAPLQPPPNWDAGYRGAFPGQSPGEPR